VGEQETEGDGIVVFRGVVECGQCARIDKLGGGLVFEEEAQHVVILVGDGKCQGRFAVAGASGDGDAAGKQVADDFGVTFFESAAEGGVPADRFGAIGLPG